MDKSSNKRTRGEITCAVQWKIIALEFLCTFKGRERVVIELMSCYERSVLLKLKKKERVCNLEKTRREVHEEG